ncbi:helix-turn-helix domain-containing protein [Neobacillus mesonae]|nr:helix-turn-helix domain-containing protein [Neobacillus mesonae]
MAVTDGGYTVVQSDLSAMLKDIPPENMRLYVNRYLGRLQAAEEADPELLLTLETYVSCHGQMNELSSRLFIHRNTAAYRLMKLERLLDMQLKSPETLLLLNLVFLFRRLLENQGEGVYSGLDH